MSRTRHNRGTPSKRADHMRKMKEWKKDSTWKLSERPKAVLTSVLRVPRRSPRTRLK